MVFTALCFVGGMSQSESIIRQGRHLWWGTCPGLKSLCIFCECEERESNRLSSGSVQGEKNYREKLRLSRIDHKTESPNHFAPRLLHRAVGMAGRKSENSHQSKTRITLLWTQTWLVRRSQTPFWNTSWTCLQSQEKCSTTRVGLFPEKEMCTRVTGSRSKMSSVLSGCWTQIWWSRLLSG